MASTQYVKIVGVPQAIAKLRLLGSVAARDTGLIVFRAAQRTKTRAQEIVHSSGNPYSTDYAYTNALRDGIKLAAGGRAGGLGSYTQMVTASSTDGGADREYAAFEEFGTYKAPAHPYLQPAAAEQGAVMAAELRALAYRLERL